MSRGKIIIIVAPSGTGKSTLIKQLVDDIPRLEWSVSCTTRPRRNGETNGVDYFFMTAKEFLTKKENNEFLEWAQVHSNYYGTLKSFVDEGLENGKYLLFDLDVQGCDQMKKIYHDDAQVIFIEPPSVEELEKRLTKRATDNKDVIKERLNNARKELTRKNDFDFLVTNDDFTRAYADLKSVVKNIVGDK